MTFKAYYLQYSQAVNLEKKYSHKNIRNISLILSLSYIDQYSKKQKS